MSDPLPGLVRQALRFPELGDERGPRFSLLYAPPGPARGSVLYIPPFAEEMNKARRMAALHARLLASQGWFVMQLDLLGCGDSAGDFGEASWQDWLDDVQRAALWLQQDSGHVPVLWGLRCGCLLAASVASQLPWPCDLLFWQPVANGRQHLQQFLRLKVAGEMLNAAPEQKTSTAQLKDALLQGQAVEVAGYTLAPELARGLDNAKLSPPAHTGRLLWAEVSAMDNPSLSPASSMALQAWQSQGWQVHSPVLHGQPFWQSQEIEVVPALLDASAQWLAASGAPA